MDCILEVSSPRTLSHEDILNKVVTSIGGDQGHNYHNLSLHTVILSYTYFIEEYKQRVQGKGEEL